MASLEVEQSDWTVTPGRNATVRIGPLGFHVSTADGFSAGFGIQLGDTSLGWSVERERSRRCRACGCTDARACAGGCWWVTSDLCSICSTEVAS